MKEDLRRPGLRSRLSDARGSVLLFAVVMMFLLISFVNILASSVASRSYFSRKVSTINEYVTMAENTSITLQQEARAIILENVEMVYFYFYNGFFRVKNTSNSSRPFVGEQTYLDANGKVVNHVDKLNELLGVNGNNVAGPTYQELIYNYYVQVISTIQHEKEETDADGNVKIVAIPEGEEELKEAYLHAAQVLLTYLCAYRLHYQQADIILENDAIHKKYSLRTRFAGTVGDSILNKANKGYTEKYADGTEKTFTGLNDPYYNSNIRVKGFQSNMKSVLDPTTALSKENRENGYYLESLYTVITTTGAKLGDLAFTTRTYGLTAERQNELGFAGYDQVMSLTVTMPILQVKELKLKIYPDPDDPDKNLREKWADLGLASDVTECVTVQAWSRAPSGEGLKNDVDLSGKSLHPGGKDD